MLVQSWLPVRTKLRKGIRLPSPDSELRLFFFGLCFLSLVFMLFLASRQKNIVSYGTYSLELYISKGRSET